MLKKEILNLCKYDNVWAKTLCKFQLENFLKTVDKYCIVWYYDNVERDKNKKGEK